MSRLLVIPAAGLGSRLGAGVPKILVQVAGATMLDRLLSLYRNAVDHVVLVINPAFESVIRPHIQNSPDAARVSCVSQSEPTGMLDAILLGLPIAAQVKPTNVWITWCDQVAVHARTIERLAERTSSGTQSALVLPTVVQPHPYIHLQRDERGRIIRVLHRREGDEMPEIGESDMGVFALSPTTYFDRLPAYGRSVEVGRATGERNFLPFIPWLARTDAIETFPAENPMEAVGINTPEELATVERYLRTLSAEASRRRKP